MSSSSLGMDLGATFARVGVVDEGGRVLASDRVPLVDRSPEAVAALLAQTANRVVAASRHDVETCGIGIAAQLDSATGRVAVAPNLGWRDVPFAALLTERLGRPVRALNDLKAAAWGELCIGAARGERDVYTVLVGSGVGSAIIANGRLVFGARGVAGEVGHVKVVPGGRRCGCGEQGCLEAYAGGHNLIAQMRELASSGKSPALAKLDPASLSPVDLEKALLAKDPAARELFEQVALHLGTVVANQVTVLNPAHLILGGGVLAHCPVLRQRVVDGVRKYAATVAQAGLNISEPALGDDAGLVGAALFSVGSP